MIPQNLTAPPEAASLPERARAKRTVVARAAIHVIAPPELVFATLADIASWPNWNPDVQAASIAGPLAQGTHFRWKAGPATVSSTVQEVTAPARLAWTGTTLGIRAVHAYALTPLGNGTLVTTQESWEGPLLHFFQRPLSQFLRQSLEAGLGALKVESEKRARSRQAETARTR